MKFRIITAVEETFERGDEHAQKMDCGGGLQRGLCTLDHQLLEPRDLTLQLSRPYELFELMALCAVLLLSGRFSDESLYFSRGR